jgi:hypothetical protein
MAHAAHAFSVEGTSFTVTFSEEGAHVVATLTADDPHYDLMAECITVAWKLMPVELLESLCDNRLVQVGEFYRVTHGDGEDVPVGQVNIFDGEAEMDVASAFFAAVVTSMAKAHLRLVGKSHFPWFDRLSPAAENTVS